MKPSVISQLEQAWAHHKYAVLEKDPAAYQAIRTLLKDKTNPDEAKFWALIEQAYACEPHEGRQNNALLHVWGYFKNLATSEEKAVFETQHGLWLTKQYSLKELKKSLFVLSVKYKMDYLLESTYFDEVRSQTFQSKS